MYLIEKNLNKLYSIGYTTFLEPNELNEVKSALKKENYSIYKPFIESEKNIIYLKQPEVILLKINSKINLTHREILGTLFSLNIDMSLFGEIVITKNEYFFYTFKYLENYLKENLNIISNTHITLEEVDINTLKDYKKEYEEINIITSSLRIDNVIKVLIHTNREIVKEKIKDKDILINYEILTNNSRVLKQNDIFSIRRYGKYKYIGIIKETKKNNYLIKILKYK